MTLEQFEQATAITDVVCVQNPYNYVDRSSQPVLEACREKAVAFVPFFPLGSGFGIDDVRGNAEIIAVADKVGATPSQVALTWVLDQGSHVLVIPGTSSVANLEENLAAAELELG